MYRVLLVDGDTRILDTNERFLRKKGYEVFRSRDGESALEIASTAALDAVIMDVDLPGLDGVSACRRLREVSRVPVLFLSACNREDDRVRGLLAGGDDYLGKPCSLTELELRLRLRIERRLCPAAARWRSTPHRGREARSTSACPAVARLGDKINRLVTFCQIVLSALLSCYNKSADSEGWKAPQNWGAFPYIGHSTGRAASAGAEKKRIAVFRDPVGSKEIQSFTPSSHSTETFSALA